MDENDFASALDRDIGPEVKANPAKAVKVRNSIPGKSEQKIIPWLDIETHSVEDAELLIQKLKNASVLYPDISYKKSGKRIIAQVTPIAVEIPYMNGVIKVASEHGVAGVTKKFQVVDAR